MCLTTTYEQFAKIYCFYCKYYEKYCIFVKNLNNIIMKKLYKILFIAIFVTAIISSSCKKDDPVIPVVPTPVNTSTGKAVNFLNIGNKWAYKVKYYDSDNLLYSYAIDTVNTISISDSNIITQSTRWLIYDAENDDLWFDLNENAEYYVDANFYYRVIGEQKTKILSKSPYVGEKFTYTDEYSYTETNEVVKINESVSVPAGTFICTKIKSSTNMNSNVANTWINKDKGIIKMTAVTEDYYSDEIITTEMELNWKNF